MGIIITQPFDFRSQKPNFERDVIDSSTLESGDIAILNSEEKKNFYHTYGPGHLVFDIYTEKYYTTIIPEENEFKFAEAQVRADWTQSNPNDLSYINHKPTLATVATSGSYNDLSNRPTIPSPQVQADWEESDSDDPAFILNKPTIPEPQVQADWEESDSDDPGFIKNKPEIGNGTEIIQQDNAPSNPSDGDLWIDTDDNSSSGGSVYPPIPTPQIGDEYKILSVDSDLDYVLISVVISENQSY